MSLESEQWRIIGSHFIIVSNMVAGIHPCDSRMVCGNVDGNVYRLECVGFEFGPIIVSARHNFLDSFIGNKSPIVFGCPYCRSWPEVSQSDMDNEIPCPGCGRPVGINASISKEIGIP